MLTMLCFSRQLKLLWWLFLYHVTFVRGAPLRGSSRNFGAQRVVIRRQVMENMDGTPPPSEPPKSTSPPMTFHPSPFSTINPSNRPAVTAGPTQSPTPKEPLERDPGLSTSINLNLAPFSFEVQWKAAANEELFRSDLERYLTRSMKDSINSLQDVALEIKSSNQRHVKQSITMCLKYDGATAVGDTSVSESSVQRAQIEALEDLKNLHRYMDESSSLNVLILQVQVVGKESISAFGDTSIEEEDENENSSTVPVSSTLDAGVATGIIVAILAIFVAIGLFVRYQRNKPPLPPPYMLDDISEEFSVVDCMNKDRQMETTEIDSDKISPAVHDSKPLTSKIEMHENSEADGMEVVTVDSKEEPAAEFAPSLVQIYKGLQTTIRITRSQSSQSSSNSARTAQRGSLGPPSVDLSTRTGYSDRTVDYASAFDMSSTRSIVASPMASHGSGGSNVGYVTFYHGETESASESSVECTRMRSCNRRTRNRDNGRPGRTQSRADHGTRLHMQHSRIHEGSGDSRRQSDPQNKWFLESSLRSCSSDLSSDSSVSTLGAILNPVKLSTTAGNRAIEVFMDGSSDSSEAEDEYSSYKEDDSLHDRSVLSGPCSTTVYSSNAPESFRSNMEYSKNHRILPIVSPGSSSLPSEEDDLYEFYSDAPSDEKGKDEPFCESYISYPDDETSMLYGRRHTMQLLQQPPPVTRSRCSSPNNRFNSTSGSLASIDPSDCDPIFAKQRGVKQAKPRNELNHTAVTMEI